MKAFSDLEQSKKLTEILPLESADMYWDYDVQKHEYYPMIMDDQFDDVCICAWSLAALLGVLPKGYSFVLTKSFDGEDYYCKLDGKPIETMADNPVDACVDMIEQLHKLNLL